MLAVTPAASGLSSKTLPSGPGGREARPYVVSPFSVGRVDEHAVREGSGPLRNRLARAAIRGENVIVDLSDCEFIDSTAISVLYAHRGGRQPVTVGGGHQAGPSLLRDLRRLRRRPRQLPLRRGCRCSTRLTTSQRQPRTRSRSAICGGGSGILRRSPQNAPADGAAGVHRRKSRTRSAARWHRAPGAVMERRYRAAECAAADRPIRGDPRAGIRERLRGGLSPHVESGGGHTHRDRRERSGRLARRA